MGGMCLRAWVMVASALLASDGRQFSTCLMCGDLALAPAALRLEPAAFSVCELSRRIKAFRSLAVMS
jgi:hypothetical protein